MTLPSSTSQPNLPWRWIALLGWSLIALAYLAFYLLELRLDFNQILSPCQGTGCNWLAISSAEVEILEAWGLSTLTYATVVTGTSLLNVGVYWLLGGLILWRQGASRIGLAVSLALLVIPITLITDPENLYDSYPNLLIPALFLSALGSAFLTLFLYLFPNGRIYPRWAAIPLAGAILFLLISHLLEILGLNPQTNALSTGELIFLSLTLLGCVFQIFRYLRDSTYIERQQTKWTLLGILIFMLAFPLWMIFYGGVLDIPAGSARLLGSLGGWLIVMLATAALPIALAIAILRYRLWDIDVIIRRTLVYTVLTFTLALVYFGLVISLGGALRLLVSGGGQVATVISTLAIAALFIPLRRRVQDTIDRRFYRQKYNAEQTMEHFSTGLRDEVDLDELQNRLVAVVAETMQPEQISLWLTELGDR